jgi:hypothetical protein
MTESQVLLAENGTTTKSEDEQITSDNVELIFGYSFILTIDLKELKITLFELSFKVKALRQVDYSHLTFQNAVRIVVQVGNEVLQRFV